MNPVGLVLEGGGMRGIYTAGVLEFFAHRDLYFPYIIGVSAGACLAVSYLSRQKGRNKEINVGFVNDSRYLSWKNWWTKRQLFGMDFIFDEIPNSLVPFDYEAFARASEEFVIGTTDCQTGQPRYFAKSDGDFDVSTLLRASSSLPFIAPVVEYQGKHLMDGGISDPIPIREAQRAGYKRNVLVLTRHQQYVKKPNRFGWIVRRHYRDYPRFAETMLGRHQVYNGTTAYVEAEERNGSAFVIQPQTPLAVGRMERNPDKLLAVYAQGYNDAKRMFPALLDWLKRP